MPAALSLVPHRASPRLTVPHRASPCLTALLPLLVLSLCAGLTNPARAQGAVETSPPLVLETYPNVAGLSLYVDPSTGATYGPDLDHPYVPNYGGEPVYTNSTEYIYTDVDTPVSVTDQAYATTIDVTLGGRSVFDMTFNAAYTDPSVQAAVAQADALLFTDGAVFGQPKLASSQTSAAMATSTVQTGQSTPTDIVATLGSPIGQFGGTVLALPNLNCGGIYTGYYPPGYFTTPATDNPIYVMLILPGQMDIDTAVTINSDVYRTVTTTTTDTLTQTYDIVGTPRAANAVPEPSSFALLALGLLPVGFLAARRRIAP